jgi:DNA-binding NarL/FixJ family response regulator
MFQDSPAPVRVLVADPHMIVREGVKSLVAAQPGLRVVGEAHDAPTALARTAELSPDVVILEASLPGLDGAHVAARLGETCPDQKVLVLTGCERPGTAQLLLGLGVRGYVLKRSPADRLVQALRDVGRTYIDPEVAGSVVGAFLNTQRAASPEGELSEREVQVIRLIALGYSNKEIAARLLLSVKTVETYKARALEKLGGHSRVDIVRHAAERGWLAEVDGPFIVPADGAVS